jgi:hypothetical protein
MSIFTEISEPYKRIQMTVEKHVEHDQQTHGRKGKRNLRRVRDRIKEVMTWQDDEGNNVSLIIYPQQTFKHPKKRSRHTVPLEGLAAVAKQERLDRIAKHLKAKE